MSDWNIVVEFMDRTTKEIKCRDKIDAAIKRTTWLHKPDVRDVDVFDGFDYIDPVEL